MNLLRNFLIGGILVVTFLLVVEWNKFQERNAELSPPPPVSQADIPFPEDESSPEDGLDNEWSGTQTESEDLPTTSNADQNDLPAVQAAERGVSANTQQSIEPVEILTDTLRVLIDPRGGDIIHVSLLKHHAKLNKEDEPFVLLDKTAARTYTAALSLVISENSKSKVIDEIFTLASQDLVLNDGQDILTVDLYLDYHGNEITKRFTFTRDSYLINVEYLIKNNSNKTWASKLYGQIVRDSYVPGKTNTFAMASFTGFALSTPDTNYKKFELEKEISNERFSTDIENRWIAFVQHYFVSAWVPEKNVSVNYKVYRKPNGLNVGSFAPASTLIVKPGEQASTSADFYAGPKDIRALQKLAPHLDKTVDYGFLWFIAKPLFFAMDNIHSHVGNWGIAIILVTLAIKALFFWPSAVSYRSMAKMRKVQPLMAELKERYGEDRQRMSQELMKLYKREKVNPLSGCLPILLQMPVFIALYWMIMESVELRHSPFFLWIQDLSVKDPYFVLPLLMGASMYIQQQLNPTPPDPMQAKVMQMLPIVFTFLFLFFPAGLVLYWVVNNTLSILQQYVITRQIEKSG